MDAADIGHAMYILTHFLLCFTRNFCRVHQHGVMLLKTLQHWHSSLTLCTLGAQATASLSKVMSSNSTSVMLEHDAQSQICLCFECIR